MRNGRSARSPCPANVRAIDPRRSCALRFVHSYFLIMCITAIIFPNFHRPLIHTLFCDGSLRSNYGLLTLSLCRFDFRFALLVAGAARDIWKILTMIVFFSEIVFWKRTSLDKMLLKVAAIYSRMSSISWRKNQFWQLFEWLKFYCYYYY